MRFINFDHLAESNEWFCKARATLTQSQKLVIDQFEYSRGMFEICKGMFILTYCLIQQGVINDPVAQYGELAEDIRENNYDQRFEFFR